MPDSGNDRPADDLTPTRKPRGAPKGSANHLTHGAKTDPELDRKRAEDPNLPAKKRKAARRRVALREQIEADKTAIAKAKGLEDDPLAMEILGAMSTPKYIIGRIDEYLDSKFFDKHGDPSASVHTVLSAADKLTGRLERLADRLTEQGTGDGTTHVIILNEVRYTKLDPPADVPPGQIAGPDTRLPSRDLHPVQRRIVQMLTEEFPGYSPGGFTGRGDVWFWRNGDDPGALPTVVMECPSEAPGSPRSGLYDSDAPAQERRKPTAQERLADAGALDHPEGENAPDSRDTPPKRRNPDAWKRWCDGEDID